jgi:UDP-galactopyranose mutase
LVHIAQTPEEFVAACDAALSEHTDEKLKRVDEFLSEISWDKTWGQMANLIEETITRKGIQIAKASVN